MPDGVQARAETSAIALPQVNVNIYQVALAVVLVAAFLTRFVRLGTPPEFYFDETYFPRTGQEIYRGDPRAWEFYGHENTHPPLSKLFMAGGMAIFEGADSAVPALVPGSGGVDNSYAWRFFGALAGVGAVLFMYLLARKLFDSEIAGLAGAFLLTCEGVAFAQSRIATPDTYVLFFVLGTLYFLVSERFLLSGVFFGAAVACKWIAALAGIPIVLFIAWLLITRLRQARSDGPMKWFEITLPAGLAVLYTGIILFLYKYVGTHPDTTFSPTQGITEIGAAMLIVIGVVSTAASLAGLYSEYSANRSLTLSPRGKLCLEIALVFGVFFVVVPGFLYFMTYWPMLLNPPSEQAMGDTGFLGLGQVIRLNRLAFDFHSALDAPHPYASTWDEWPLMARPVYFYAGSNNDKIYSLGNPVIFWFGLPALAFALWQSLAYVRAHVDTRGILSVAGRLPPKQAALLFVVVSYLAVWLPMAATSRVLFIYHYLPALIFLILALAYAVDWLWRRPEEWGRYTAIGFLVIVALTFAFLYPHLAAVPVADWVDKLYYPFDRNNRLANPLWDWE
ncbi:MAG TPA: phospholipid carrier-dependent glycosyltransferase [Dehalococcoidia bacterium]|jgi:dolichyl-phosphate-mannose--protein O-mannosyl transferase|nr:phospholipid carrier-dependent glycosyltransferase [Dehalococcoidia bacterium]